MAINLIKGQRVEIEAGLTHLKVEMGTHDTLVSQKGYYYRLIKNQLEL